MSSVEILPKSVLRRTISDPYVLVRLELAQGMRQRMRQLLECAVNREGQRFGLMRNRNRLQVGGARFESSEKSLGNLLIVGLREKQCDIDVDAVLEALTSISRAGADLTITYHAKDVARWLDR